MQGIRVLSQSEFWRLYEEQFKQDFPESEIRRRENFKRLWDLGCYEVLGAYEEDTLIGYACYITQKKASVVFGDYIAIQKTKRQNGNGSDFQRKVLQHFSDYKYLVFEVEDPDYAADDADRALRERRIGFYERLGAVDCAISTLVLGDRYRILAFSIDGHGKNEFVDWYAIIKDIYELTFPNPRTWEQIEITKR